ncbi:hypothetical protein SAMN02745121_02782 [Nannocystis exedens]|uniref:Secreted protein n=1 Tax=Nannocystis exedens TaxID=54 RepID=A0A1I1XDW2_9BACT|nr:hypothetical protein [Nannocystis exedens]PCC70750.1 hypothetical protein NAEX_03814 [Nannocystis exedens]SFE03560.1 hypothetical protein SAMN02745121_02782 [Nannocystis exedens]
MHFKKWIRVMVPNSCFALFAALAGPELTGQSQPVDVRLTIDRGDVDPGFDEFSPPEDADLEVFDSPDDDAVVPRQNPHHPAPNSNPCKKKENEPKGCPGNQ